MFDPVARRFRQMARRMERVNRRIATSELPGKVIAGSQDMETRTLRLDLGRSADGRVIKSPPVPWPQQGTGTMQLHHKPADGEQLRLRSPSGTVGTGSQADWGTYDDDHQPPSNKGDEAVFEYGKKSRITMTDDAIVLKIGASTLTMRADGVTLETPTYAVNP